MLTRSAFSSKVATTPRCGTAVPLAAPKQWCAGGRTAAPQQRHQQQRQAWRQRAAAAAVPDTQADAPAEAPSSLLPGKRFEVTLRMPIGVVFAQKEGGPVFVESVTAGGSADQAGVKAGDILNRCSAITLKAGMEGRFERVGHGDRPYDNFETVMIDCEGLAFKTVMGALKSNNPRWGVKAVTIVVRRVEEQQQE